MGAIWLKNGRDKSVRQRHPWIFSGAIQHTQGAQGDPQMGETVEVRSQAGEWLAWAAYSPFSQIRGRIWSWEQAENIDAGFIRRRLEQALHLRQVLVPAGETNALRLVHGESDGLPGVVVDRYAGLLVVQILSAGAEVWRETLVEELVELTGLEQVYERSDVDVRSLEGLPQRTGSLHGDPPPRRLVIRENGLDFYVDVCAGQKTGFYIDQRRSRQRVGGAGGRPESAQLFLLQRCFQRICPGWRSSQPAFHRLIRGCAGPGRRKRGLEWFPC